MVMLILETFLLMLLSALLGTALGRLLGEAYGDLLSTDRPWLRDPAASPAAPVLPPAPTLLADDERQRLAASLAESAAAKRDVAATVAAAAEPVSAPPAIEPPAAPEVAPPPAATPALEVPPTAEVPPTVEVSPAPGVVEPPPPAAAASPALAPLSEADAGRATEADAHGTRPLGLAAPRDGRADDLKRIRGIGRQNEARLNGLGVWHFDQIAAWTPENIRWAGAFLAFQGRIEREDWVGQAKVLASGGTTEFAARVDAGEVPTSSV